ncbi:glucokinase [soil metagenome]
MSYPRLVGDVGGTNVRLAWKASAASPFSDVAVYEGDKHPSLQSVMELYLREHPHGKPSWCAIGIANPIVGDHVQMTNRDWSFSISALQQAIGLDRLLVINDFAALAMSLPSLPVDGLRKIGGTDPVAGAPIALLGAGTGLGVSGLLWTAADSRGLQKPVPIGGEGGHVSLAAANDAEEAVLREIRHRYGHSSAERALSGPGLVNLYEAICKVSGAEALALEPSDVSTRAMEGSDAACIAAVEMFFDLLGSVAGNLALTLGARGGVYISGGIVPRLGNWIERSGFLERFAAKGRFCDYLAAIPSYVIEASPMPALIGAERALEAL